MDEYSSLMKNHTWDLCPLPKGRMLVWCRWLYHTKYAIDGSINRYMACIFVKVFSQVEGIDYSKTFVPIAKIISISLVLSLVASRGWIVF